MSQITVSKIRPIAWKVYTQGADEAGYLQGVLERKGIQTSEIQKDSTTLSDPPLYAFIATPKETVPFTEQELVAILEQDDQVQTAFED